MLQRRLSPRVRARSAAAAYGPAEKALKEIAKGAEDVAHIVEAGLLPPVRANAS